MSDFYVGQEVVCVNNGEILGTSAPELRLNAHYTVSGIHETDFYGRVGITVREVPLPWSRAFAATRFRPVKRNAIAVFRQMCVDAKKKASA